jgi:precorrin-2 dehydrogenase/sirohydrochlorin ferrochelatase
MICPKRYLICNIADTPPLCDYYLGEGAMKIFRPTESPTTANCGVFKINSEDIKCNENLNEYRKH